MKLENKHVVITGGTSGIGLELVEHLEAKNKVSVFARPSHRLDELRERFAHVSIYEADFADLISVERAADALAKTEQDIDVLINNAAVQYTSRFTDADFRYDSIQREIDVNFTSICVLVHLLLPSLMQPTKSMIVNVNSGLALAPKMESAIYCATKAALNSFSKSLSYQLEDTSIEVRQVFLPLVATGMTEGRGSGKLQPDDVARRIVAGIESDRKNIDIGKVKLLRIIQRLSPGLAARIMKGS